MSGDHEPPQGGGQYHTYHEKEVVVVVQLARPMARGVLHVQPVLQRRSQHAIHYLAGAPGACGDAVRTGYQNLLSGLGVRTF